MKKYIYIYVNQLLIQLSFFLHFKIVLALCYIHFCVIHFQK